MPETRKSNLLIITLAAIVIIPLLVNCGISIYHAYLAKQQYDESLVHYESIMKTINEYNRHVEVAEELSKATAQMEDLLKSIKNGMTKNQTKRKLFEIAASLKHNPEFAKLARETAESYDVQESSNKSFNSDLAQSGAVESGVEKEQSIVMASVGCVPSRLTQTFAG